MALPELMVNSPQPGEDVPFTVLAAAITSTTATSITLIDEPPAALLSAGQFRIVVGSEIMLDTTGASGLTRTVTRGVEGSTRATHVIGSAVKHYLTAGALDARYAKVGTDGKVGGSGGTALADSVVSTVSFSGHPTTGSWATGQAVIDTAGIVWVCTAGGTPGTWIEGSAGSGAGLGANTFTGVQTMPDAVLSGLTGAAQTVRFAGATTSGAPVTGAFLVGDAIISLADGKWYVCTVAGSPGTWVTPAGGAVASVFGRTGAVTATSGDYTAAQVTNAADLSAAAQTFNAAGVQRMGFVTAAGYIALDSTQLQFDFGGAIYLVEASSALNLHGGPLLIAGKGLGVWGHAAPASQPATPVTLADVIAVLQAYGLTA